MCSYCTPDCSKHYRITCSLGVLVHICNPSTLEAEAGQQTGLHNKTLSQTQANKKYYIHLILKTFHPEVGCSFVVLSLWQEVHRHKPLSALEGLVLTLRELGETHAFRGQWAFQASEKAKQSHAALRCQARPAVWEGEDSMKTGSRCRGQTQNQWGGVCQSRCLQNSRMSVSS